MSNVLKVEVLSRQEVASIDYLKVKYAIISITDNTRYFTSYPTSDINMVALLALKFADTDDKEDIDDWKCISNTQAKLILDFAFSVKEEVDTIIINCDAGISRSSGIAAALSYIFNGTDSEIWDNPKFFPNKLVYDTILNAAGYSNTYTQEDIETEAELGNFNPGIFSLGYH
jgi:hypothetical protein